MDHHLIVRHPFDTYARGDVITDATIVASTLATSSDHVIRVEARTAAPPDAAAPQGEGKPAA